MRVKQLLDLLQKEDPDAEVILSSDEEGNNYRLSFCMETHSPSRAQKLDESDNAYEDYMDHQCYNTIVEDVYDHKENSPIVVLY